MQYHLLLTLLTQTLARETQQPTTVVFTGVETLT